MNVEFAPQLNGSISQLGATRINLQDARNSATDSANIDQQNSASLAAESALLTAHQADEVSREDPTADEGDELEQILYQGFEEYFDDSATLDHGDAGGGTSDVASNDGAALDDVASNNDAALEAYLDQGFEEFLNDSGNLANGDAGGDSTDADSNDDGLDLFGDPIVAAAEPNNESPIDLTSEPLAEAAVDEEGIDVDLDPSSEGFSMFPTTLGDTTDSAPWDSSSGLNADYTDEALNAVPMFGEKSDDGNPEGSSGYINPFAPKF